MAFKCPNCEAVHEKVPGYVSQEAHTQRLNAKTEEARALSAKVDELSKAAGDTSAIRAERDRLAQELEAAREAASISQAFASHGIAEDDTLRASFDAIYRSHVASLGDDDEKPSFVEWLGSDAAQQHVLLRPHFRAEGDGKVPDKPAGRVPPRPPPNTDAGTAAPPDGPPKRLTPADLAEFFSSDAYKAKPYADRREIRTRLQAQAARGELTELPDLG